ncbi:MAG: hypothetical protein APF77_13295 [Clostridia bacterium BRH_c25]|nr:MAG: hypothetical protein APF77_13295 [Clostridia bacterium BRH_c25]
MKKWMRIGALLLVLVMMLGALSACSSSGGNAPGQPAAGEDKPKEKVSLKISHHPYLHALPGYYAEENGLYDEAGFDYSVTMYAGGPPQNEALASDAWEVGTTGTGGAILGALGYNLKVIGFTSSDTNTTDLWVRPDHPLAKTVGEIPQFPKLHGTPEQWKGLTVICPSATSTHMVLLTALDALGLKESDIKMVDMAVAQGFPAFKAGQGDMVALWSPFGFLAEKEGWVKVASAADLNVVLPCLIVASEKAVKERPEVVQKWLENYLKGADALREDPAKAADLLFAFEKENGIKLSEEDAKLEIQYRPIPELEEQKKLFDKNGKQLSDAESILLTFVDFLVAQGRLKPEDKQKLLDNKFVDASFLEAIK